MKAALFLLLALGAASASACADYSYCHCYDSNRPANDNATDPICNYFGGSQSYNDDIPGEECFIPASGPYDSGWENCSWRIYCKIVGATGSDSGDCQKMTLEWIKSWVEDLVEGKAAVSHQ